MLRVNILAGAAAGATSVFVGSAALVLVTSTGGAASVLAGVAVESDFWCFLEKASLRRAFKLSKAWRAAEC